MSVTTTCRDISELTINAQKACNLFITECKKQGLNVLITETYRSQERQDYLYSLGRTKSGNIVTWTKNSRHTSRCAWDICKNVKGQEYSDNDFFKQCGNIAKSLGITWGGTWKTPDTPHFEIDEDWQPPKENVVIKEYTSPNDIVYELGIRGIVQDTQGLITEIGSNLHCRLYWLARKLTHYIRQREVEGYIYKENVVYEYAYPTEFVWELANRGIVSDTNGMCFEIGNDIHGRLYWLARKGCQYIRCMD